MVSPQLPDISVPWSDLEDEAADMAQRARITAEYLAQAAAAWDRFRSFYQEPDTQERVYTALNELSEPTLYWQRSLQDAADTISNFAAAGRALARRRQELQALLLEHAGSPETGLDQPGSGSPDSPGQEGSAEQLNEQAAALAREWSDLQQGTAAILTGIRYGDGAGLPMGAVHGGSVLPDVQWSALTGVLDERFGALHPSALLPSLTGLDEEELREWAAANPEAAALLAARTLDGPFRAGTPEALMRTAMADDAHLTRDGVDAIRTAWLALDPLEQERLMALYPGVFGNLNGVPFAQRAKANIITVAGYRNSTQTALERPSPYFADYPQDDAGQQKWLADFQEWQAEQARLTDLLRGLNHAVETDVQVVMLSVEGDGRIVSMTGTPSSSTERMAAFIPGMGSRLGELENNLKRFESVNGDGSDERLGFYWQGTDLPNQLNDTFTSSYSEDGAVLLAAFDYAVDLEVPAEARTTYIGYSAGGSLLGTAERVGLDSTNIVYVAPAGPGHEVGGPDETENPDANRYLLQTRDDIIQHAQTFGGGFHGPTFWETGTLDNMGVTRLETGFLVPSDPGSLMKGHSDYFTDGSTAATNIKGVINESRVSLHVENKEIPHAGRPETIVPIEENPEDYANGKLETVRVKDLEK